MFAMFVFTCLNARKFFQRKSVTFKRDLVERLEILNAGENLVKGRARHQLLIVYAPQMHIGSVST